VPIPQTPDLALRLQRQYRLQGLPSIVLAPEVVPVVILDTIPADAGMPSRDCMGWANSGKAGADYSQFVFENPSTSGLSMTLDRILVGGDGDAGDVLIARATAFTGFTQIGGTSFRAIGTVGRPSAFWGSRVSGTFPTAVFTVQKYHILAGEMSEFEIDISLDPGDFIVIYRDTLNVGFDLDMFWQEFSRLG